MPDVALPREVFLSHASGDGDVATRLVEVLRGHGVPVGYSVSNIRGAQQWHDEIGAALNRCDWFTLLLSPNAVKSMWVKRELLFALQQNHFANRIIPVVLEHCQYEKLSWTLPTIQMVDFTRSFDEGCRDLLRIWGIGFVP